MTSHAWNPPFAIVQPNDRQANLDSLVMYLDLFARATASGGNGVAPAVAQFAVFGMIDNAWPEVSGDAGGTWVTAPIVWDKQYVNAIPGTRWDEGGDGRLYVDSPAAAGVYLVVFTGRFQYNLTGDLTADQIYQFAPRIMSNGEGVFAESFVTVQQGDSWVWPFSLVAAGVLSPDTQIPDSPDPPTPDSVWVDGVTHPPSPDQAWIESPRLVIVRVAGLAPETLPVFPANFTWPAIY